MNTGLILSMMAVYANPEMTRPPYSVHKELLMVMNFFLKDTTLLAYGRSMARQPNLDNFTKEPVQP